MRDRFHVWKRIRDGGPLDDTAGTHFRFMRQVREIGRYEFYSTGNAIRPVEL
jgi:hypothetical protein